MSMQPSEHDRADERDLQRGVARIAKRFLLFFAVWLIVSEGRSDLLPIGFAACLATSLVSLQIWRARGKHVRLWQILGFLPGFLWRSLKGGIDVSWRVFHPRLPIRPAFVRHHCREDDESARVLLCDVLTLMPGTLSAGLSQKIVMVHLLTDDEQVRREIQDEEARVSQVFSLGVPDTERSVSP